MRIARRSWRPGPGAVLQRPRLLGRRPLPPAARCLLPPLGSGDQGGLLPPAADTRR
jgi:hypothetical protein